MADAIALIVIGSGEVSEKEAEDLLQDVYWNPYDEVGIVFPVDKDLFTKTVQTVVGLSDPEDLYPVRTKGAELARKSSKYKADEIKKFEDIFDPEEYKDWDDVHVVVALPADEDDPDFDRYAGYVEVAIDNGFSVKDLTKGLDDVRLAEDDVPAAEEPDENPEPVEPEARKRRQRKAPRDEEPVEEPQDLEQELAQAAHEAKEAGEAGVDITASQVSPQQRLDFAIDTLIYALQGVQEALRPDTPPQDYEHLDEPPQEVVEAAPKRGRGRPRTRGIKQIWDEDSEDWIPRPAGRLRKGTKFREIDPNDEDKTLDEGVV